MNKILKYTAAALMPLMLSGCLDEVTPTDGVTQGELDAMPSIDPLINGITKHMNTIVNTNQYGDVGYPSLMIVRDVIMGDMPVWDPSYYYFATYSSANRCGDWQIQTDMWNFYNKLVHNANIAIEVCSESDANNLATALCYRAFAWLDMCRMYEMRPTGTSLDSNLDDVAGLTVPIVTETTTETQSFNNPRAPFYKLWRFIITDLRRAEAAVRQSGDADTKNKATLGLVKGLQARLWLEIATRFWRYPADMATALSHDNEPLGEDIGSGYTLDPLGVTTEQQAWQKAADAARAAIDCGYSPLTKDQWFDPNSGFNSATANNSWIWAILMSSSDEMVTSRTWQSWVSFMAPETTYGVASNIYKATFMIDSSLFQKISYYDWRRWTWINPHDLDEGEEAFDANYADKTNLSYDDWSQFGAYCGFKYHPGQGNGSTSTTGNCVDIPLMRVEEMYFIEAEAAAHAQGVAAGVALLNDFMNVTGARYDDASYVCYASNLEDFSKELVLQKRVEFWAEGLTYFDMRRHGYAVTRGYSGTNHPVAYRLNSLSGGYVPTWSTLYIPRREANINRGCVLNPDPSPLSADMLWSE